MRNTHAMMDGIRKFVLSGALPAIKNVRFHADDAAFTDGTTIHLPLPPLSLLSPASTTSRRSTFREEVGAIWSGSDAVHGLAASLRSSWVGIGRVSLTSGRVRPSTASCIVPNMPALSSAASLLQSHRASPLLRQVHPHKSSP